MKRNILLLCFSLCMASQPAWAADTGVMDDGLARLMFNRSYKGLFTGETRICARESDMFSPAGGEEGEGDRLFYDRANGFMEFTRDGSPCGCEGVSRGAAYKKSNGEYLFVSNDRTMCNYRASDGVYASEEIERFMPPGFGLHTFLPKGYQLPSSVEAGFYLDFDIPRQGTDTVVRLRRIPLGLFMPNDGLLLTRGDQGPVAKPVETNEYVRNEDSSFYKRYYGLSQIVPVLFDPERFTDAAYPTTLPKKQLLKMLLSGEYKKIGKADRDVLETLELANPQEERVPLEHLADRIHFFYTIYRIEQDLTAETLLLGWDAESGRFYIKEERPPRKKFKAFLEFLESSPFWVAIC